MPPEPHQDAAEKCPDCHRVWHHRPDCPRTKDSPATLKARLHWAREQRDHELAVLYEQYLPRLRALHDEMVGERERVYGEYERRVSALKVAA